MLGVDQVWSGSLSQGVAGTAETLATMAALVRRDSSDVSLVQKAREIVSACEGHGFECEIRALFHFVRDQIVYRRDPLDTEWVQDAPRTIFVFGSGDCDCKVVCLCTLLACLGHRPRFKVIGLTPNRYRHVYCEVQTRDGWMPLDPTPEHAPAGWEARGHAATYEIFQEGADVPPFCLLGLGLIALWWLMKGN